MFLYSLAHHLQHVSSKLLQILGTVIQFAKILVMAVRKLA